MKSVEARGSNPRRHPETALGIFLKNKKIRASKSPKTVDATGFAPMASKLFGYYGRSDRNRTCGILVPNQARYQLRYTPE